MKDYLYRKKKVIELTPGSDHRSGWLTKINNTVQLMIKSMLPQYTKKGSNDVIIYLLSHKIQCRGFGVEIQAIEFLKWKCACLSLDKASPYFSSFFTRQVRPCFCHNMTGRFEAIEIWKARGYKGRNVVLKKNTKMSTTVQI